MYLKNVFLYKFVGNILSMPYYIILDLVLMKLTFKITITKCFYFENSLLIYIIHNFFFVY
jgi:hypothetical protein